MHDTLLENSNESSKLRFDRKRQCIVEARVLVKSKRRIFRDNAHLREHMEERTWYMHLKAYAKNFLKGRKKGDVCDICNHYDEVVKKKAAQLRTRVRRSVCDQCPDYFAPMDSSWKQNAEAPWDTTTPAHLAGMKKFVETHRTRRASSCSSS